MNRVVVTRFPALACSPHLWSSHIRWSHLILGPAQEQRLVKRESLLAQASPTYYLSRRIPHRACISYHIYRPSQSVNTALAHHRSFGWLPFLPSAGHDTDPIDNPRSAQANVNSHALASHHPRPLPSSAHIHSNTYINIIWPQTTKTGRIDLYNPAEWSKTSTLRQETACCMRSLRD